SAIGPLLGGVLIDAWGWSAVYWFRAPLAAVALLLLRGLPLRAARTERPHFDAAGAGLMAFALATAVLALTRAGAGASVSAMGLGLATLAGLYAFIAWEKRCPSPLLDLGLFRRGGFLL